MHKLLFLTDNLVKASFYIIPLFAILGFFSLKETRNKKSKVVVILIVGFAVLWRYVAMYNRVEFRISSRYFIPAAYLLSILAVAGLAVTARFFTKLFKSDKITKWSTAALLTLIVAVSVGKSFRACSKMYYTNLASMVNHYIDKNELFTNAVVLTTDNDSRFVLPENITMHKLANRDGTDLNASLMIDEKSPVFLFLKQKKANTGNIEALLHKELEKSGFTLKLTKLKEYKERKYFIKVYYTKVKKIGANSSIR